MRIAKWVNSLAVRLPSVLCRQRNLKLGDNIALVASTNQRIFEIVPYTSSAQILSELRVFRGRLQQHERLTREEANARQGSTQ